jgi:putative Mg2+ transporter-C (MgtC) family protein
MFFADDVANVLLRLLVAALVGAAIGLDREVHHKPAGMRTHALVCLGAALLVVVALRAGPPGQNHLDAVTRVMQGIIAGVGFLGGGAILKSSSGPEAVHGLTTAATIWLAASLGVACGAGQWAPALLGTALAILVVIVGVPVEKFVHRIFKDPAATIHSDDHIAPR